MSGIPAEQGATRAPATGSGPTFSDLIKRPYTPGGSSGPSFSDLVGRPWVPSDHISPTKPPWRSPWGTAAGRAATRAAVKAGVRVGINVSPIGRVINAIDAATAIYGWFTPSDPNAPKNWDKTGWKIYRDCGGGGGIGPKEFDNCGIRISVPTFKTYKDGTNLAIRAFYDFFPSGDNVYPYPHYKQARAYERINTNVPLDPWPELPGRARVIPGIYPGANPNVIRRRPDVAAAVQPPPQPEPPKPEPENEPDDKNQPGDGTEPERITIALSGRAPSTQTQPERITIPPRRPPGEGEKERKVISRSKMLGIAIFRALDDISESAEVVDAFFEALPKQTQDKWKCNRKDFGIDAGGQYGIDNADCKARALWHNWHKVDLESAFENVIKNYLQDKFLGYIHKYLPKQQGSAFNDSFRGLNKELEAWLDEYIDVSKWT